MKILVTGDLHWNDLSRDQYRHDFVKTLVRWIKKYEVRILIILGDLTEEKDRHGAWLVNKIFDHIYKLAQHCLIYIVRGNHDCLVTSIPFFQPLGKLYNTVWINEPRVILDPRFPGARVLFLPHTRNHKKEWKRVNLHECNWIFTHNTFAGAKAETGFELKGVPKSVFLKRQNVVSGDVHVPQRTGQVTYVGAPYPIDFGDDYDARVLLLDSEGNRSSLRYKGPWKRTLDIDVRDIEKGLEDCSEGDILKVRLHMGSGEYHKSYLDCKEKVLEHFRTQGCVVYQVQPVIEKEGDEELGSAAMTSKRTDKQLIRSYASTRGVSDSVLKTGLRLMRKI